VPTDADLVFDVRFLPNPHFVDALRPLTGLDPKVSKFVLRTPEAKRFMSLTWSLLAFLLPQYVTEGKAYVTIAIGCTGGRHRSVFVAERLATWLASQGRTMNIRHRDTAGLTAEEC